MSLRRMIDRQGLKNWMKTNKISEEWHRFQIKKYGLGNYEDMQRANKRGK